ncbi:MAG TPA: glycosyltransferase [Candidatus Saccharimonadia bacterium]|nr:glycosyltransferase [Candidatus Saccharimonadia bacterium]
MTLFSPGPVACGVRNVTADLSGFEAELAQRGDSYIDLLRKHPLVFISLARQAQSELIARAFEMANAGKLDIVHVYTNEEDVALPFSRLCRKPIVFTHHDPFSFLVKYRHVFPKYADLNWISLSMSQRRGMPNDTNWVANIPHGLDASMYHEMHEPAGDYLAYLGRIVEPKGVHLAIAAVRAYNASGKGKYVLKIAGKHYSGEKDGYWQKQVRPEIDGKEIVYEGFIDSAREKQEFIGNAAALMVPSTFDEPFGMVMVEALACGTPVVGLASGAVPEVTDDGQTGVLARKSMRSVVDARTGRERLEVDEAATVAALTEAIGKLGGIKRSSCRRAFETHFTARRMCQDHLELYRRLITES